MIIKSFLYKCFGKYYTRFALLYRQMQTYAYSILHPYHYNASRYIGTFLEQTCELESLDNLCQPVDRVIYIFWTGENEIPPNRLECIHSLERTTEVEVRLITPKNLSEYIKEDDPLPEAYQYLSYIHRADYLRTYFMYHYGGGYADIKRATASWIKAFDRLDTSDAYAIGYPEVGFMGVANQGIEHQELKMDLELYWRYLIGNCAYICRPHTPFVTEWYTETKGRVLAFTDELRKHPAGDPFGQTKGYPVPWVKILGEVFHPLCLKYHDKLLQDKCLLPSFRNYR